MSFKCAICKKNQSVGSIPEKVVTETRVKYYPKRYLHPEQPKEVEIIDKGGKGWEIKKEIEVCEHCSIIEKNKQK